MAQTNTESSVMQPEYTMNNTCQDQERILHDALRLKDNYEIEGLFVKSANAVLYTAKCKRTKQRVIMKQLPKHKVTNLRKIADRMVPPEVYFSFAAYHENSRICRPIDYFERNSSYVLVMEHLENSCDLFELTKKVGGLSESAAKIIFSQILLMWESLDHAGICHRDIKDENIIINIETLECTLIDFGCATEVTNDIEVGFSGTPEFYPPEYYRYTQYRHDELTAWSIGVVLYLLLAGDLPYNSIRDLQSFDIQQDPLLNKISPGAAELLLHLLEKCPEKRATLKTAKHYGLLFLNQ